MLKNIEYEEEITGYYFTSHSGDTFEAKLATILKDVIDIRKNGEVAIRLMKAEIPKAIKVLQAVYDLKGYV
jgi:hypothetical protein